LGLTLQEVLTATVRLRGNRPVATDAASFRNHVKQLLSTAEREARRIGYSPDDIALALYAVVTFLDESVLNSSQAMFSDWPSRPLQEEIFGGHMGGEIFFQHLKQLLTRQDSEDVADVLEVFLLCLMLGFRGRYSGSDHEIHSLRTAIQEKLGRIRGSFGELSPGWALPGHERRPRSRDRWLPWLGVAAAVVILAAAGLFLWFRTTLDSGAIDVQSVRATAAPAEVAQ
jgi:type VI secretion system protein ImpK